MIVISKPNLQMEAGQIIISYPFIQEGKKQLLWYKIPEFFQAWVVTERLDAALVGLLPLGLRTGSDIYVEGTISEKLLYTLQHYLIPALCLANPSYKKINISASALMDEDINTEKAAGTGMSCGVDSFATYYDHIKENGAFKIEYFTFFNVGSHGDLGGKRARKVYNDRLKAVEDFALKESKKVISVDSNLSEILKMNFQQTHSLRSCSCILLLQKLFKYYYYSSAFRFDHFEFNPKDTSDYDFLIINMLNTESTTFFASAAQHNRIERTIMISEFSSTYDYLDVCTNPHLESTRINCSRCHKCMRTQLTLELVNKLDRYDKVFDLEAYYKEKANYIGGLLLKENCSNLDLEVRDYLKSMKFIPSLTSYYYYLNTIYKIEKKKFKKILRRNLLNT